MREFDLIGQSSMLHAKLLRFNVSQLLINTKIASRALSLAKEAFEPPLAKGSLFDVC